MYINHRFACQLRCIIRYVYDSNTFTPTIRFFDTKSMVLTHQVQNNNFTGTVFFVLGFHTHGLYIAIVPFSRLQLIILFYFIFLFTIDRKFEALSIQSKRCIIM